MKVLSRLKGGGWYSGLITLLMLAPGCGVPENTTGSTIEEQTLAAGSAAGLQGWIDGNPALLPRIDESRMLLREGWRLQSSARIKHGGVQLATAGFRDQDWYSVRLPRTVLAALADA